MLNDKQSFDPRFGFRIDLPSIKSVSIYGDRYTCEIVTLYKFELVISKIQFFFYDKIFVRYINSAVQKNLTNYFIYGIDYSWPQNNFIYDVTELPHAFSSFLGRTQRV